MKKIRIKEYKIESRLGELNAKNFPIYLEDISILKKNFDPEKDDFLVDGSDMEPFLAKIAYQFYLDNYQAVFSGNKALNIDEFNGIIYFLEINPLKMAKILGIDRATLSRALNAKSPLKKAWMIVALDLLRDKAITNIQSTESTLLNLSTLGQSMVANSIEHFNAVLGYLKSS